MGYSFRLAARQLVERIPEILALQEPIFLNITSAPQLVTQNKW